MLLMTTIPLQYCADMAEMTLSPYLTVKCHVKYVSPHLEGEMTKS